MRGERGAASLLLVSCLAVLLLVGAALGVVAAMVRAHRTAQAAADLAALAAASALQRGGEACLAADALAAANAATLVGCEVAGDDVVVRVRVTGPRWLGQTGDLAALARAGPGQDS